MQEFSYQPGLKLSIPTVKNNKDFNNYYNNFERINQIICQSGVESHFISYFLEVKQNLKLKTYSKPLSNDQINRLGKNASSILRCAIARSYIQESYQDFSRHLAESSVLQQFCGLYDLYEITVPSKSKLQSDEKMIPEEIICQLNEKLFDACADYSENPLSLKDVFTENDVLMDATCVLSNIHYPVDWMLLKDGAITLLKSINRIRKGGLKSRIKEPSELLSNVNQLAISFARCKGPGSVIKRKKAFRNLRDFTLRILSHSNSYYSLLTEKWEDSSLSVGEKDNILRRIDSIRSQLPQAIKLASERLLKGNVAKNEDKILSLYDNSTNVIVRGKAGARVEYGCKLMLAELKNGFIVDWELYKANVDDVTLTVDSINRIIAKGIQIKSVVGDRGCDGPRSRALIEEKNIKNAICARSVTKLVEQMKDPEFKVLQKRRAQTEARIAIVKNNFIGNAIRTKNFISKSIHIAWSMLTHNLKLVAKLSVKKISQKQAA